MYWKLFKYSLQKVIARTTTTTTTNNEALGFLFYYLPLTSPLQVVSFFHLFFFITSSSYLLCHYSFDSLSGSLTICLQVWWCMSCAAIKHLSFPLLSCSPRAHKPLSAAKPLKCVILLLQCLGLLSSIFPLLVLWKHLFRALFPLLNSESFSDLKAPSPCVQPGANRTAHPSLKRQTRSPWLILKLWMWPSEALILPTHLLCPKARQPGGLGAKSRAASATLYLFGLQY